LPPALTAAHHAILQLHAHLPQGAGVAAPAMAAAACRYQASCVHEFGDICEHNDHTWARNHHSGHCCRRVPQLQLDSWSCKFFCRCCRRNSDWFLPLTPRIFPAWPRSELSQPLQGMRRTPRSEKYEQPPVFGGHPVDQHAQP